MIGYVAPLMVSNLPDAFKSHVSTPEWNILSLVRLPSSDFELLHQEECGIYYEHEYKSEHIY